MANDPPYRNRGDGENVFDEMTNQCDGGGFTMHDLALPLGALGVVPRLENGGLGPNDIAEKFGRAVVPPVAAVR